VVISEALNSATPARWVRRLVPRGTVAPEILSRPEIRGAAVVLGADAVGWALEVAHDIYRETVELHFESLAEFSGADTVRTGLEEVATRALLAIDARQVMVAGVSPALVDGIREFVRAGVALERLLASMRFGNEALTQRFMTACTAFVDEPHALPRELQFVSAVIFDVVDQYAEIFALEYEAQARVFSNEDDRWRRIATAVLSGNDTDLQAAEDVFGYRIRGLQHMAMVAASTAPTVTAAELDRAAVEYLGALGAGQTMTLRTDSGEVWAWGNFHRPLEERPGYELPPGVRASAGPTGSGADGFRRSHSCATRAHHIGGRLPSTNRVTCFAEVELLGLLIHDLGNARDFRDRRLGVLADDKPHMRDLCQTLATYLDTHSPLEVARRLSLARSTINYRLQRVEEILGVDVLEHSLELRTALRLHDVLDRRPATAIDTGRPPQ
jgi:hypothetical protein